MLAALVLHLAGKYAKLLPQGAYSRRERPTWTYGRDAAWTFPFMPYPNLLNKKKIAQLRSGMSAIPICTNGTMTQAGTVTLHQMYTKH